MKTKPEQKNEVEEAIKELSQIQKYSNQLDYILRRLKAETLGYYKATNLNLKVWAFMYKEKINMLIDELNHLIQNNKEY